MTNKPPRPSSDVDRLIDDNLRHAFESLANEPVPDRFMDLIQKLRANEEQDKPGAQKDE